MRLRGCPFYVARFANADALFTRPPHTSTDEMWFIYWVDRVGTKTPVPIYAILHLKGERFYSSYHDEETVLIEDEQCQRIGGGHKAAKFRFLLFL